MQPGVVAHADWGVSPRKRWTARAVRTHGGAYRAQASEPVGEASVLLRRLRDACPRGAPVLVGFDFPIGVPRVWAERARVQSFVELLRQLGTGAWSELDSVAERADQISWTRPFYPMRPGGTRQAHLLDALGLSSMNELRRACEHKTPDRPAASPLFWTLGAKQVGKAALSGWREVLAPGLLARDLDVVLWPFAGKLETLLEPGRIVLTETYPAECYRHLGVDFPQPRPGTRTGKRVQASRRAQARALLDFAAGCEIELEPELVREIEDGFGGRSDGEDRFDSVVGLLGMLEVALGRREAGEPPDELRRVEGWILGQAPLA